MASFATQVQIRRGTDAENDAFTGAEGEVTMDLTNKQLRVHDGQTTGGMKIPNIETVFGTNQIQDGAITEPKLSADLQTKINEKTSGAGRNIGDIFWTTRTDSALNGAVEANGAQYNFADVNGGDNNVQALLESGALPSVSIADYESAISSKGWCDKIGYDSGSTSFRVPKLTPYIVQKENIPVVGNGMTLGLTNGEKFAGLIVNGPDALQVNETSYGTSIGSPAGPSSGFINNNRVTVTSDPTKSGMIADLSNDSFKGRVMIQLFNSATDEAVAKCTEVLSDVAGLKLATDGMIDYVIESQEPTEANGYTWYRLYKSGWVEQGGHVDAPVDAYLTVSLPLEMQDTKYSIVLGHSGKTVQGGFNTGYRDQTTTSFILVSPNRGTSIENYGSWQVSGMSAQ